MPLCPCLVHVYLDIVYATVQKYLMEQRQECCIPLVLRTNDEVTKRSCTETPTSEILKVVVQRTTFWLTCD